MEVSVRGKLILKKKLVGTQQNLFADLDSSLKKQLFPNFSQQIKFLMNQTKSKKQQRFFRSGLIKAEDAPRMWNGNFFF